MAKDDALKDYVEVNVRIEQFWKRYPNGRIETEVFPDTSVTPNTVMTKAKVYRDIADAVPAATGHAYEVQGSSYINKTSFVENGETSAVGRALAILGFEIRKSVASREEVANARLQQTAPAPTAAPAPTVEDGTITEAQVKMLVTMLTKSGYIKGDKPLINSVLTNLVGYDVAELTDIKKADVQKVAEFLATHKKTA